MNTTTGTPVQDVLDVTRPVVKSRKKHVATGSAGPNFGPGDHRKGMKKCSAVTTSTAGKALSPLLEGNRREFMPPVEESTATPFKPVDYTSRASMATRLLSSIIEPFVCRVPSLPKNSSPLTMIESSPQRRSSSVPAVASRRTPTEEPVIPALNLIRASDSRSSVGPSVFPFDVNAFSTPPVPGYALSEDEHLPHQPSKVATFRPMPRPKNTSTRTRAPSPLCSPTIAVLQTCERSPDSSDGEEKDLRAEIEEQDELAHDGDQARASEHEDDKDSVLQAAAAASSVEHPAVEQPAELVGEGADEDSSDANPSYKSFSQIAAEKAKRQQNQQDAWTRSKEAVGAQSKSSNAASEKPAARRTEPDDGVTTGFDADDDMDDEGDWEDEEPVVKGKGKGIGGLRGAPTKQAITDCEAFGEATRAAAMALCEKYGLKLQTVMTCAGLGLKKTMTNKNLPNAVRQVWADKHREDYDGASGDPVDMEAHVKTWMREHADDVDAQQDMIAQAVKLDNTSMDHLTVGCFRGQALTVSKHLKDQMNVFTVCGRFSWSTWHQVAFRMKLVLLGTDQMMPFQPGPQWASREAGVLGQGHYAELFKRINHPGNTHYSLPADSVSLSIVTAEECYKMFPPAVVTHDGQILVYASDVDGDAQECQALCVDYDMEALPAQTLGSKKLRKQKCTVGAGTSKEPYIVDGPRSGTEDLVAPKPVTKTRRQAATSDPRANDHTPDVPLPDCGDCRSSASSAPDAAPRPVAPLPRREPLTRPEHPHAPGPSRRQLTPHDDFSDSDGCDVNELQRPPIPLYVPKPFSPLDLGPPIAARARKRLRVGTSPCQDRHEASPVAPGGARPARSMSRLPPRVPKRTFEQEEEDMLPDVFPVDQRQFARTPPRRDPSSYPQGRSPVGRVVHAARHESEQHGPFHERSQGMVEQSRYPGSYPQRMGYLEPPQAHMDRGYRQPPQPERMPWEFSGRQDLRPYGAPRAHARSPYYEQDEGYYQYDEPEYDEPEYDDRGHGQYRG
ncbi:hypothetical protein HWV62_44315 [Athelia sp. TMB]|nr:hypothetical protein HWV62_44315 [Athelia sp. TMB]